MGNTNNSRSLKNHSNNKIDIKIELIFKKLSSDKNVITFENFKENFGLLLSTYLWAYLQENKDSSEITLKQFSTYFNSLSKVSVDVFVKIFKTPDVLLKAIFEAANITETKNDEKFVKSLITNMVKKGSETEQIIKWINTNCPKICQPIQNKIFSVLDYQYEKIEIIHSDILSDIQMFVLLSSLPTTIYFPQQNMNLNDNKFAQWTKLYSSKVNGLSINRFVLNALDYKGTTVCIFELKNDKIFVIAVDEKWRQSLNKFGGPNTFLYEFQPNFQNYKLDEKPIYCNFKYRSGSYGLFVGQHFNVDGDMNNVLHIEVWGCSGAKALEEQKKQQQRNEQQSERNGKVPLPGTWDENPDKTIMEMAGYQFSNERNEIYQNNT